MKCHAEIFLDVSVFVPNSIFVVLWMPFRDFQCPGKPSFRPPEVDFVTQYRKVSPGPKIIHKGPNY